MKEETTKADEEWKRNPMDPMYPRMSTSHAKMLVVGCWRSTGEEPPTEMCHWERCVVDANGDNLMTSSFSNVVEEVCGHTKEEETPNRERHISTPDDGMKVGSGASRIKGRIKEERDTTNSKAEVADDRPDRKGKKELEKKRRVKEERAYFHQWECH